MEVILIFRQLSKCEIGDLTTNHEPSVKIYSLPGLFINLPLSLNVIPETIVKEASDDLINTMKKLGNKDIEGISLSDLFTFDKMPLWHYQKFRIFFLLRKHWIINHSLNYYSKDYDVIHAYVPDDYNNAPTPGNVEVNLIKNKTNKQTANKTSFISKQRKKIETLVNYSIFFFLRVIISLFRNNQLRHKKHVVIDRSFRQQCRNLYTLDKKWDNYNLSPLFDTNPEGLLIISEVETPKLNSITSFKLHSYFFTGEGRSGHTVYGEYILFRGMTSIKINVQRRTWRAQFDEKCRRIEADYMEKDAGESRGLFSHSELRIIETFITLRKSSFYYFYKYLCYERFFKKYSFSTVSTIDENSPATRCILDSAKTSSIKTIGIQHGNIGDSQPAYLYTETDRENSIMVDRTIVWGEYFQDFLINKANYPPESVKIAGQMRSDLIPAMIQKSETFRSNISNSPFIVTFASQPISDVNYRYQIAYSVFHCLKRYPQIKLILKLHPAEQHAISYYTKIAEDAGYVNPDIRYDIDLYELLTVSDLVITGYSTVGTEAVYFGKPLIIYDPFKEDLLNYVKEGVAFLATDQHSLNQLVDDLMNSNLKHDKMKYDAFIRKYAFSIDGKATSRTLKFITEGF